jgi:hypothetical protein
MRMIPHERSLVENMEGRPFALLGVSGDETRGDLAATVKERGITWRNWWDGEGKIQFDYGVEGFPTIFLLDTNGVVREMFEGTPPRDKLEQAVERLVQEAERKVAAADGQQPATR